MHPARVCAWWAWGRAVCACVCWSACGEVRANLAYPRAGAEMTRVQPPRQSRDCRRRRPLRLSPSARRPLSFGRVLRHRCTLARFGSRHLSTPPPHIRLDPQRAIHPPLWCAWLGRSVGTAAGLPALPTPIASIPAASRPLRRWMCSGPVAEAPRSLRAKGTVAFSSACGLHAARLTRAWQLPRYVRGCPICLVRLFCPVHPFYPSLTRGAPPNPAWQQHLSLCFSVRSREAGRCIGARAHRRPDAAGPDEGVADGDGRGGFADRPSQTRRIGGGMAQTGDKADARWQRGAASPKPKHKR